MKSLAIVGMMFLSAGLFAQSTEVKTPVKQKEKVCVKKCDKDQKIDKMKKAPIRKVDARTSSVQSVNHHGIKKHPNARLKQIPAQKRRMVVPLSKKSVKVDEKM